MEEEVFMDENQVVEKEGISFSDIWSIIKKYWIGLISIIAGCVLIGILTAFLFMPKEYQASEGVTCMTLDGSASGADVNVATQNLEIAYSFVYSNDTLKRTSESLEKEGINISYKDLKKNINVVKNNQYKMTYTYTSNKKEEVPIVLNTFTDVSIQYVKEKFSDKIELNRVSSLGVDLEDVEDVSTSKVLVVGASGVVGIVIGLCYEFIANSLDKTIKNKKYIEDTFGIKVIGMIPDLMSSKDNKNN